MKRLMMLAGASLLFACAEPADDGKGEEENALTDGKDDSFFRPTEHGELRFGVTNDASITDDEQFHAWTFELSDDAELDIATAVSRNLDTVMYLYRRAPGEDSWGRYIEKNDDDGDLISSRLTLQAEAGEYRVIVKAFKSALRGSFDVDATCAGPGCPGADSGTCEEGEFTDLPRMTSWGADCAFDIANALSGEVVSRSSTSVTIDERCGLSGLELTAVDYFHEWWNDIVGFDDAFRYDPDDDVVLDIETETMSGDVTVIRVDAPSNDEGAITFVFDGETLLSSYQHNQSATFDTYCENPGASVESPGEGCFIDVMRALPHDRNAESAREFGEASANDASDPAVAAALQYYVAVAQASADDTFGYEIVTWESYEETNVAEVTIEHEFGTTSYTVMERYNGWVPLLQADPNGIEYVCER